MSAYGETVVVRTRPLGYSGSVGAQRLLLVRMIGRASVLSVIVGVTIVAARRPDDCSLAMIDASSACVFVIGALAAFLEGEPRGEKGADNGNA